MSWWQIGREQVKLLTGDNILVDVHVLDDNAQASQYGSAQSHIIDRIARGTE